MLLVIGDGTVLFFVGAGTFIIENIIISSIIPDYVYGSHDVNAGNDTL